MTYYTIFQLKTYGNSIPEKQEEEFENGKERQDREAEWTLANEEREIIEYEY